MQTWFPERIKILHHRNAAEFRQVTAANEKRPGRCYYSVVKIKASSSSDTPLALSSIYTTLIVKSP